MDAMEIYERVFEICILRGSDHHEADRLAHMAVSKHKKAFEVYGETSDGDMFEEEE